MLNRWDIRLLCSREKSRTTFEVLIMMLNRVVWSNKLRKVKVCQRAPTAWIHCNYLCDSELRRELKTFKLKRFCFLVAEMGWKTWKERETVPDVQRWNQKSAENGIKTWFESNMRLQNWNNTRKRFSYQSNSAPMSALWVQTETILLKVFAQLSKSLNSGALVTSWYWNPLRITRSMERFGHLFDFYCFNRKRASK